MTVKESSRGLKVLIVIGLIVLILITIINTWIGLLLLLVGGVCVYYQMKKNPSGDQPSEAYDLVGAALRSVGDALVPSVKFEAQINQWKKEGYITTSIESLDTDDVNILNTTLRDFEQDLSTLKKLERHVQELKRSYSTGNVDSSISRHIASIESQLHNPRNIPHIEQEFEAIEQIKRKQQDTEELFTHLQSNAKKLTRYASLTNGSFAEAKTQIIDGRYEEARKTLRLLEDPIDALLECESSIAAWKANGYNLTKLEGLHPRNADEVIAVIQNYRQNISRLETIAQELESKKRSYPDLSGQPETAERIRAIEQNLNNPTRIDTVEKDYQQLNNAICQFQDKQKILEQNLRNQAEKVQREAVSPAIKQEIDPIITSIRERDFPHAQELLQDLAGQQLTRVDAALSKLRTDGAVVSLSSDPIRKQIAAQHYGDAIIDSEKVIAEITHTLEAKQKIIEKNIRDQAEKVKREAVSPVIKQEIDPIITNIRQHDIPRAQELLQDLAGQQLSRVNTTLSTLQTNGAVVSLSSDPIRKQIAAQHYSDAILDSEKTIAELTQVQEMYTKAKVLKPTVTEPAIIALFENGKYEEFIRVCSEWQERRMMMIALKERATASLKKAGKFGRVPMEVQENLASEKIADIECVIKDLDAFAASAQPALTLALDHTSLDFDCWHKVYVQITNNGDAHAFDVSFTFSSEFETKRIKTTNIEAGKISIIEIGILPKKAGNNPLEIAVHCRDGHDKPYSATQEFWIDVTKKDTSTTSPQTVNVYHQENAQWGDKTGDFKNEGVITGSTVGSGTPMREKVCPQCQKQFHYKEKYCPDCGKTLR